MDQIEYVKSNKGGLKIIYKGYMYTVHKNKKCGGIRWRCAQRSLNCKGSISTNLSGSPQLNMPHNHLPDYQSVALARNKFEDNIDLHTIFDLMSLQKETEQKSTSEAKRRYGISESNIRRWRRLKNDILEKASHMKPTRKSARSNNTFESPVDDFDAFELSSSLDSMPLEQRLSKTSTEQEPVLQSQPLSPTKLKVTRQSAKPAQPSPKPATPDPPNEEVCLRWNSHHSNMQSTFPNLLLREQYVDATLVAEGQTLKCHRLILSSCSPYFEEVLSGISPFQHPVLFMKDVPFWILKSLCDFMYAGEVHIFQNKLEELLAVAETLKIKGLAGKTEPANEETKPAEPAKQVKDEKEKREEKEVKDKKKHQQTAQQIETPAPKNTSKPLRSTYASKRNEKAHKELVKSDDILDPLDLLEPVYEELTKESKSASMLPKFKEAKNVPVKKGLPKKVKKRKLSEEREESPPPMFLSRKGTRSRPNVKVPKYYHPTFDRGLKSMESLESTIVREPHTDQADPLLQVEEIKAEPLDLVDDVIEIEDNIVGFSDHEMPLHEEEIMGNYDSPIVNISDGSGEENKEEDSSAGFKKISLVDQPIIMDVHSVSEKPDDAVKIVDVSQLTASSETVQDKNSDPLATDVVVVDSESNKAVDDPLKFNTVAADDIKITNVETVAETSVTEPGEKTDSGPSFTVEDEGNKESGVGAELQIAKVVSENETEAAATNEENANELGFHIAKVASEQFIVNSDDKDIISEDCASELGFQITSVVSGHFEEADGKINEQNPEVVSHFEEADDKVNEQNPQVISHFEGADDKVNEQNPQVVSHFEEANDKVNEQSPQVDANDTAAEATAVCALPEMVNESQEKKDSGAELSGAEAANVNDAISEETRLIADSLEQLLEK